MNDERSFERFVADHVAGGSQGVRLPDDFYDDMHSVATTTRQRPEWLALIKEPPMRTNSRVAVGSPTVRVLAIMAATLLLAVALAAAGVAGQRLLAADGPIVVAQDGSGDHTTIAEAVAAAADGDEILVMPGTYTESVVIDKDITLRGEDRDTVVISAPDDGPTEVITREWEDTDPLEYDPYAVLLLDSNGHLRDLTFRGEPSEVFARGGAPTLEGLLFDTTGRPFRGTGGAAGSSIVVNGGSAATIRGNELVGGGPIAVFEDSEPLVEGNVLRGGPHIWGAPGDGAVYRGNTIEEPVMWAFWLGEESSPTIEDNVILRPGQSGIEIWGGTPTVRDNTIEGPGQSGVNIDGGSPIVVGNDISGGGIAGVRVSGGEPLLQANSITDAGAGVLWSAGEGSIEGNTITGGRVGLAIARGAPAVSGNTIEGAELRGIAAGRLGSPVLSGNHACGSPENLFVDEGSGAVDDGTNEVCPNEPTE